MTAPLMFKKPRIVWCSSTPFPEVYRHLQRKVVHSCPWKSMLLERAQQVFPAEWLVVCQGDADLTCDFVEGDVRYVMLGRKRRLHHWTYDWRGFEAAAKVIKDWEPDLVHVHGTENYFGLLRARSTIVAPTLIAIQGLLGPYVPHAWGNFSTSEIVRMEPFRDLLRGSGLLGLARQWRLGSLIEAEIIAGNAWFGGRTNWDRAHLTAANPHANYRELGEILRPEFAVASWDLTRANRNELFFTNLSGPHKGGDVLIEALRILRQSVPEVRLKIGGSMNPSGGYGRQLLQRIRRARLEDNVEFLGFLDGPAIVRQLQSCRAFVSATFIDNSPNSLGEAMVVGTPCVCSYVGGIPSLGDEGEEILFFPSGDAELLAQKLLQIINDDELAQKLSGNSRRRAREFHSPEKITQQLSSIYREMLGDSVSGKSKQPISS